MNKKIQILDSRMTAFWAAQDALTKLKLDGNDYVIEGYQEVKRGEKSRFVVLYLTTRQGEKATVAIRLKEQNEKWNAWQTRVLSIGKIKAQVLYALQTLTGFISGGDLYELFLSVMGDFTPSGHTEIELLALRKAVYGGEAFEELRRALCYVVPDMAWYILGDYYNHQQRKHIEYLKQNAQAQLRELHEGGSLGVMLRKPDMEASLRAYNKENSVELLNKIREEVGQIDQPITHEMLLPIMNQPMLTAIPKLSEMLGLYEGFNW